MPVPRTVGRVHGVVMLVEAVTLGAAASLHLGLGAVRGEQAPSSAIGELVVAGALVCGAVVVRAGTPHARLLAFVVTAFALLGVIAGLTAIALDLAPRTVPDLVCYLVIMVVLLISFGVLMSRRPT